LAVHVPGEADANLYAYVRGMTLKNVDPIGLDETTLTSEPGNPADENAAKELAPSKGNMTPSLPRRRAAHLPSKAAPGNT